jgi:predicted transcriptional regulator
VAPARKKKPPVPLHELEAEVMEEVWRRGEASVREVLDKLNRGSKKRAYTTVMTILNRLDEKGLLKRRREGRRDIYIPMMTRERYLDARAEAEVGALVSEFGDVALSHFAQQVDQLDPEQLKKLRRLAEDD